MAKDQTEVGITGQPVPKPRTAIQQYKLEKKRREAKHLGKNVGGHQYSSDVNPYTNPRARTYREFVEICEAVYGGEKKKPEPPKDNRMMVTKADELGNTEAWKRYKEGHKGYKAAPHLGEAKVPVTRQAGDFRYSGKTGQEKAEIRANVLSNSPDPQRRRQANTIRSKIKTVADRDVAQASSDARQKLYKRQQRRANQLARQSMNTEETSVEIKPATAEEKRRIKLMQQLDRLKREKSASRMQSDIAREEYEIDEAKVEAGKSKEEKQQIRTARSGFTGQYANQERRAAHRVADERRKDLADIRKGKKTNSSHFSYLP